jgi:hypothetical protein
VAHDLIDEVVATSSDHALAGSVHVASLAKCHCPAASLRCGVLLLRRKQHALP